jgi:manganese transport protein
MLRQPAWDSLMDTSAIQEAPKSLGAIVRRIGPGLIISANVVGSGELIATTLLGADVGFMLLWFIIFSCFIKVFIQVDLGRYAISEGVSTLDALNALPGPRLIVSWCVILWTVMYVGTLFQLSGMLGTVSQIFDLLFRTDPAAWTHTLWTILTAAAIGLPLFVGRYRLIERFSIVMVVFFSFTTLAAVLALQATKWNISAEQIGSGLILRLPADSAIAFAVFGMTGVGASELIYYPIWCLEKGYARYVGPRDDSQAWVERARSWIRVMNVDAWVSMIIYTITTIAFYVLGAAVLHGSGADVSDSNLVAQLSTMYTETFGTLGLWVFLSGAFMVLFSTLFVATGANARLFADASRLYRLLHFRTDENRQDFVKFTCLGIVALLCIVYLGTGLPVTLVLIGGSAQALMLPFLGFAAQYFRYHVVHPQLRPGRTWSVFAAISFLSFVVIGVYQFLDRL